MRVVYLRELGVNGNMYPTSFDAPVYPVRVVSIDFVRGAR